MAVVIAKAVIDTPWFCQGEIDAKPIPEPKATNINEAATATKAPAKMAGQDAADLPTWSP